MRAVNKIDLYLLIKMEKKNVHKVYKFLQDVKYMMKVYYNAQNVLTHTIFHFLRKVMKIKYVVHFNSITMMN